MSTRKHVTDLVRPDIQDMEPYTPIVPFEVLSEQLGRPAEEIIKLDANESPYGPSPKAVEALTRITPAIPIYPDPEARKLRAKLETFLDIDRSYILCGAGADELIDLIMRLFLAPGDKLINCPPTFGMYPFDAALVGADVVRVPRRADFSLDLDGIEAAAHQSGAKLIFITSPNNPDGGLVSDAELERLMALPLIVVLDEAYVEFSGKPSRVKRVLDADNLIVLRTFSKWAGLAGLRVGYGVFPLWIMSHLWKIKQPYNVNVAADAAARASLDDLPYLMENVRKISTERKRLEGALKALPYLEPYPSRSNFVLCRVVDADAYALKRRLAEEFGILIRYYAKPGLKDHVRFTAGTPQQTDILLEALSTIGATL